MLVSKEIKVAAILFWSQNFLEPVHIREWSFSRCYPLGTVGWRPLVGWRPWHGENGGEGNKKKNTL